MRIILVTVTLLAPFIAGTSSAQVALPFETAVASTREIARERVLDGVVEAVKESTVSAQTSGRVADIYVDVDDYVPKGTVILRLRDTEQRSRVARAEADLEEAQTRRLEAAQNFERISRVYAKKLVSQADFDRAKAALGSAQARVQAAQAALTQAREELDYTVVRAPYGGVVTKRHVEVGESVRPGQPLMSGFSLDQLRVHVDAPQQLVNAIRQYRKARVIRPDAHEESVAAERITIFPYATQGSNTFAVRVELPPAVKGLFPGMLVKVAFEVGRRSRLAIPAKAVAYRSEVTGVYVVKPDGTVELRQIRVGRESDDGMIEVLAGLADGERVALDPIRAAVYMKDQGVKRE